MRHIVTTSRFERRLAAFVKRHPELTRTVENVMLGIAAESGTVLLKAHKLKGPLRGCYAARLGYEHRIVFISERDSVCFLDIGTHDDVYR